jgi:hypothetical protein
MGKQLFKMMTAASGIALVGLVLVKCAATSPTPSTVSVEGGAQSRDSVDLTGYNYAIDPAAYADREFIQDQTVREKILADLSNLDRNTQAFTRYFTFTSLYNSGVPDKDLRIQKFGLAKLLNHLSYRQEIKNPQPVDDKETIFRIDLRDYGWSRNTWEFIVQTDPYSVFFRDRVEQDINRAAGTRKAYMRADFLAFAGSQGFLYNAIMDIPRNVRTMEFRMGIDADRNLRAGRVERAGFAKSQVAFNNRVVERHEGRFGYYWKSFDFQDPDGRIRRNIFEFPLGSENFRSGGNEFETGGGEMIWELPNGFQVYMAADGNGNRLDKVPVDVAADFKRSEDREVTNALGCMNCHNQGLKTAIDEIRGHVEQNAFAYNRNTVEFVRAIYPGSQQITSRYTADIARFKAAMDKIGYGNNIGYSTTDIEPIIHLSNWFETELSVERAAAEVGMKADEFVQRVSRSGFLSRRLGILFQKNGRVKRDVFEDNFFLLVRELGIGVAFRERGFRPTSTEQSSAQTKDTEVVSANPGVNYDSEPVHAALPEGAQEPPADTVSIP